VLSAALLISSPAMAKAGVANEANGQLHDPAGRTMGHFLSRERIFIILAGRYL
jgi:hypothetical protein